MISKKKLIASLTTASLLVAVGVGATLAYFSDKDVATNTFNIGNVSGKLTETSTAGVVDGVNVKAGTPNKTTDADAITFDDVMPSDVFSKVPTVTINDDSNDAWLRVKVEYVKPAVEEEKDDNGNVIVEAKDAVYATKSTDGLTFSDVKGTGKDAVTTDLVTIQNLNSGLVYNAADGYFYYKSILKENETVKLFDQVAFNTKLTSNDIDKLTGKQMVVTAELVQADNVTITFGDTAVTGWPN